MRRPYPRLRSSMAFVIRPEQAADFASIAAVVSDAFGNQGNDVARLVELIRASDAYEPDLALVAEDETGIAGHVMLSWAGVVGGSRERVLLLSPMSVRGDRQRRGAGRQLIVEVLARADGRGEPVVVVERSEEHTSELQS